MLDVTIMHWHFEDLSPLFIRDDDYSTTGDTSIWSASPSDLLPSSHCLLCCFFDIGEFDALSV